MFHNDEKKIFSRVSVSFSLSLCKEIVLALSENRFYIKAITNFQSIQWDAKSMHTVSVFCLPSNVSSMSTSLRLSHLRNDENPLSIILRSQCKSEIDNAEEINLFPKGKFFLSSAFCKYTC